jgi:membrane fusion protein (multidrug efflux system)
MKPLLCLIIPSILLLSCSESQKQQTSLPEVSVINVVSSDLPVYVEYVGQAYGLSDVQVQARVQGLITAVHFKEGLPVKEGQLLYTIDDLPYQANINEARAKLADVETDLVKTKSDLDRVIPLAASNALSQRDLDAANAAYNAAKACAKAAQAGVDNAAIQLGYASVTAPISGTIGISNVRVGDFVGGYSSSN